MLDLLDNSYNVNMLHKNGPTYGEVPWGPACGWKMDGDLYRLGCSSSDGWGGEGSDLMRARCLLPPVLLSPSSWVGLEAKVDHVAFATSVGRLCYLKPV
jgi:hypothetical protein